jgi:hypothetical protein
MMANGHGGARAGAGRKPKFRPRPAQAIVNAEDQIADELPTLVKAMIELATGKNPNAHFGALKYLLDRTMGKAVSVDDLPPATLCTPEELRERALEWMGLEEWPDGTVTHIGQTPSQSPVRNPEPSAEPPHAAMPSTPHGAPQPKSEMNETRASALATTACLAPRTKAARRSRARDRMRRVGRRSRERVKDSPSARPVSSFASRMSGHVHRATGSVAEAKGDAVHGAAAENLVSRSDGEPGGTAAEDQSQPTEPAGVGPQGEAPIVFVTRTTDSAEVLKAHTIDAVARPAGGAWSGSDLAPLRGRDVVVLGDGTLGWERYEPGWAYEDHKALTKAGIRVAILVPREISVDLQPLAIPEIIRRRDVALREGALSLLPEARKAFDKEHGTRASPSERIA